MRLLNESAASLYKTPCNVTFTLILVRFIDDIMYLVYECRCGEESDFDIVKRRLSYRYKTDTASDFSR